MQHALLELLAQPAVVSLIVGVKRAAQLEGLIAAAKQPPPKSTPVLLPD